ncbi:hypothetical protein BH23VER1_BH23VER1_18330 [soil metagenome]
MNVVFGGIRSFFGVFLIGVVVVVPPLTGEEPAGESFGIYAMNIEPGYHALGFSFLNPALARATVGSSGASGGILALGAEAAGAVGHWLATHTGALFLEVVGSPGGGSGEPSGHRFEIDEKATRAALAAGEDVVLDLKSPWNTWVGADLAGCEVEIIPHQTLGQLLPPETLHADMSFSRADQAQLFRDGVFQSYYVLGEAGSFADWRKVGGVSSGSMSGLVIHPGEGVYFVRSKQSQGALSLAFAGRVRQGPFAQPLSAGINFIAEGHPKTRSFVGRNALRGSFTGGFNFKQADQAQIPEGKGYVKDYLASDCDSFSQWIEFGGNYASQNDTPVFDFRHAVFLNRNLPDPAYRLAAPWLN